MKQKNVYICQQCGYQTSKWIGKCIGCGQWNSMTEEIQTVDNKKTASSKIIKTEPKRLGSVSTSEGVRISCGIGELDRVLGGGLVHGSLVLVGGDPGIGKSTLLLQTCGNIGNQYDIIYVSGEESEGQVKLRSDRLGINADNVYILNETDIDGVILALKNIKPRMAIIDSIQTVYTTELDSVPGSVSQIRECCLRLMRYAKENDTAIFIVGHVTKEGNLAGPRVLEHMVDCVLYFEGERHQAYRVLRAVKNRFGSTNEIGVFEMKDVGLIEVDNPSKMLLSGRPMEVAGSAVVCALEGTRTLLAEVQALISPTGFGTPRRMASGVDYNRSVMLLAVIEKRLGLNISNQDAYINVVGGLKITETAADLALVLAVVSSLKNIVIPHDLAAIGEVGLTGELRAVSYGEKRALEIAKLGFKAVIMPYENANELKPIKGLSVYGVKSLGEVMSFLDKEIREK